MNGASSDTMCIEYRIEKESRPGRGPYRKRPATAVLMDR